MMNNKGDADRLLMELRSLCLPLLALIQEECTGSTPDMNTTHLKLLVTRLHEFLKAPSLPRRNLAASVPLAMLPLYVLLSKHIGTQELKPSEVDLEVLVYNCVQDVCDRCGPSIIEADPSVYLKLLTHLVMRLGLLCTEDRSRNAPLSHLEGGVLSCLRALLMAPQSTGGCSKVPLTTHQDEDDRGNGGGESSSIKLYMSRSASVLLPYEEEQWHHVKRVLAKAAGGGLLAQTVQGLLDIAAKDRDRSIRLSALCALEALVTLFPLADVWRPFYPGVFGGLVRVIVGDFKQGSQLTGMALGLLLEVTALVTSIKANRGILSSRSFAAGGAAIMTLQGLRGPDQRLREEESKDEGDWMPPQVHVEATNEWAVSTIHQLAQLFPVVLRVCRSHPKARVRAQLLEGTRRILREGCQFFAVLGGEKGESLIAHFFDTVVGMQQNECANLASQAQVATAELMVSLPSSVLSAVLDRLVDLFQEVPGGAMSTDEQSLRITIDLITGYIQALSHQTPPCLPHVLCTSVGVIMETLSQALEFERPTHSHSRVLEVIEALPADRGSSLSASVTLGYYRSHFHNLRDARSVASIKALLEALGGTSYEFVHLVVDHVVRDFKDGGPRGRRRRRRKGPDAERVGNEEGDEGLGVAMQVQWVVNRLPQVFIMNGVLKGAGKLSPTLLKSTVQFLIDEVVAAPKGVWQMATSVEEEAGPITAELLDCRALLMSLLLEGVGDAAEALGKEHFDPLLQYTLYPIIAKRGDSHPVVCQAAATTLHRLAILLGQGSIQALLSHNMDYILQSLYSRVRQRASSRSLSSSAAATRSFPVAPGVMESLLIYTQQREGEQTTGASFALKRDLASMIFGVLDDHSMIVAPSARYLNSMMKVLLAMVRAVAVSPEGEPAKGKTRRRGERQAVRVKAEHYWHHRILEELGMWRKPPEGAIEGSGAEEYFRKYHADRAKHQDQTDSQQNPKGGKEEEELLEIEKLLGPVKEGEDMVPQEDESEPDDKPGPQEALMLEVLDRCAYFLANPSLLIQHTVIQVILEGLSKIRHRRFVLLPTLHKLWPSLMARLHAAADLVTLSKRDPGMDVAALDSSQSFAMALLIRVLSVMGDIAGLVGDFLSIKFMEDLWPIMRKLLIHCAKKSQSQGLLPSKSLRVIGSNKDGTPSPMSVSARGVITARRAGADEPTGSFTAMESKLLEALVQCLNGICRIDDCYHFLTPMVNEMAQTCGFLLQHHRINVGGKDQEDDLVVGLYQSLARYDEDAVWVVAMEAAEYDLWQRPLPTTTRGGGGTETAPCSPSAIRKRRASAILKFLAADLAEGVWCSREQHDQQQLWVDSATT